MFGQKDWVKWFDGINLMTLTCKNGAKITGYGVFWIILILKQFTSKDPLCHVLLELVSWK